MDPYPSDNCPVDISAENITAILERYDTFLLDCDGVLWDNDLSRNSKSEGIAETVDKLRKMGKHLIFLSNNSRSTKDTSRQKFRSRCGFDARDEDITLVTEATAAYLRQVLGKGCKVFLCGSIEMQHVLQKSGFKVTRFGAPSEGVTHDDLESDIKAVVFCYDPHFDCNKLFHMTNYLVNPDCLFVTTSREPFVTLGSGDSKTVVPIVGSLLAAVETASGRKATVIGKPSPNYFHYARMTHPDLDPARTVMVGDMLLSDIALAGNCGLDSILVSTGVDNKQTTRAAFQKNPKITLPTYIIDRFSDIGQFL